MIVRLKAPQRPRLRGSAQFQFYDSPIKSLRPHQFGRFRHAFQFYDSPIKSGVMATSSPVSGCFNSMIVRLKDKNKNIYIINSRKSFNSMIVRLKGQYGDTTP